MFVLFRWSKSSFIFLILPRPWDNHAKIIEGGGHWGIFETAKPKKKIIQNRKTAKKFGQNRKPHTKPSKTDTMVTSGAYRAN